MNTMCDAGNKLYGPLLPAYLVLGLWLMSGAVVAAPDGAALLRACAEALAGGFEGMAGRMCAWYVTPCDCETARKPGAPRVCLPPTVATQSLARAVITGLRSRPDRQVLDADVAAAQILSRLYPCVDDVDLNRSPARP